MITFEEYLDEALMTFGGKAYPKFGQIVIMAGGAGCYPSGTEFFTGTGWKNIEEYSLGDRVLQFNPTTNATNLVNPSEFIDLPVDQFYNIKNRRVDFTTSETHKHLLVSEKNNKYVNKSTKEIEDIHKNTVRGNRYKLVTSFNYNGEGVSYTDDEIRLMVALFADATLLKQENKYRVSLKKDRKISRFKNLLKACEIEYREYKENDFTRFEFYSNQSDKEFESYWYNCSQSQLNVVCDEVLLWDGSITDRSEENHKELKSFSTTSIKSRDFIQFAFTATGNDVSIHTDTRDGRIDCYQIVVNNTTGVGISKNERSESTTKVDRVNTGANMYCFTVPSGYFVVRQNGKIYVSGNSGKGFQLENLVGIEGKTLDVDELKKMAMASNTFAKKVKDETGYDISNFDLKKPENVSRIHELLSNVYNLPNKRQQTLFTSILSADERRKPNLVFDVTLKDMGKLESIVRNVGELGYDKKNVHLVWVVNDINIAVKQNKERDRVVPEEILMATHEGAALTMRKIISMGSKINRYLDGDIYLTFNKVGVDTDVKKSDLGGKYIKDANYIHFKKAGKSPIGLDGLTSLALKKIADYVPNTETWDMVSYKP